MSWLTANNYLKQILERIGLGLSLSDENGDPISSSNPLPVNASVSVSLPTTIAHISNNNISNVTATQIATTSHECKKCIVTASENNTGFIRFGGSTLTTTTGIILYSGESFELEISNTNLIYAIAEVNGEDVSVTYLN